MTKNGGSVILKQNIKCGEKIMTIYGRFQVAVRGPAETVRQLPELVKNSPDGYSIKSLLNSLVKPIKAVEDTSAKDVVVISWKDSSDKATLYMDLLEHIARKAPGLDIAVGVKTSNSVSSGANYSAYYSRAGENTLHPDNFMNSCAVDFGDSVAHLLTTGRDGRKHDIDLAEHEDWYHEGMLYELPDQIPEFFDEFPHIFWYTPYDDAGEYEDEDDESGDWGEWYALNIDWEADASVQQKIKKLIPGSYRMFCSMLPYTRKKQGIQPGACTIQPGDYTDEALEQAMTLLFPGKTFHVESKDGRPYIWDDDGTEYFPGGVMECVEHGGEPTVYWNFPDEDDEDGPWVPFA